MLLKLLKGVKMGTVEPIRRMSDIRKIEKELETKSFRDLLLFDLGINSGLRISDILNLNVEDVKNHKFIQVTEKKTQKFKKIPLNAKLINMLKIYCKDKNSNEPLFKNCYNNRLSRISAYRIINKTCKKLNIEAKIGTHTLRKTFGYHHYRKFKDVVLLQKIFNHSTPFVTLRYIGINEDEIFDSYKNFV